MAARLSLSLGARQHGASATRRRGLLASMTSPSSSAADERLVVLGAISSPLAFNARAWQRHVYGRLRAPGVQVFFALGNMSGCPFRRGETEPRALLREERRRHDDFVVLGAAPDCSKQSVAKKTLAWYQWASELDPPFRFVAKCDDDSLVDLPKLRHEALLVESAGRARSEGALHAYIGGMRWRAWLPGPRGDTAAWRATQRRLDGQAPPAYQQLCRGADSQRRRRLVDVGCACGHQSEASPANGNRTLGIIVCQMGETGGRGCEGQTAGSCAGALGPFPFADGSFVALSRALIRRTLVADDGGASDFAGSEMWEHEDAGLAFVLLRQSLALRVPLMYFTLRTWVHNMKWPDMRPSMHTRLPDAHVMVVHRVANALHAELVADAFAHFEKAPDAGYVCSSCSQWGMNASQLEPFGQLPSWQYGCCRRTPDARSREDHRRMNAYLKHAAVADGDDDLATARTRRRRANGAGRARGMRGN